MKKLTQKLVLSVITMALVVVALGTSTFAWFTLTNQASLQSFEAQVTAGEGIEISLGTWSGGLLSAGGTATITESSVWYAVLPQAAIDARIDEMFGVDNFRFIDLTSGNGVLITDKLGVTVTSSGFIPLDIFFRSATPQVIRVTNVSMTGPTIPKTWVVDVPSFTGANSQTYGTDESNKTMSVAAWTAARVSVQGVTAFGTSPQTTVFERNEVVFDSGSATAVVYNSNQASAYVESDPVAGGASYYYAKGNIGDISILNPLPSTVKTSETGVFEISGNAYAPVITTATATIGGVAQPYTYGKAVVRIWIEGFDADAFDAIFTTVLAVQLRFDSVPV